MIPFPIALFFGLGAAAVVVSALAPLQVAMLGVLAFAGPHNWFELRYLLGRLPSRLVVFRSYFILAAGGVATLSVSSIALVWIARDGAAGLGPVYAGALWYTALIGWIACLVFLRFRERPTRRVGWILPAALAATGLAWSWPLWAGLLLIYAHPLLALWFLDRELRARHRGLRAQYRRILWLVPAGLGVIWLLAPIGEASAALPPSVVQAIGRQSGAFLLQGGPAHRLIASHAFLELLHYVVWIVMIPLLAVRGRVWSVRDIAFGRSTPWLGWALAAVLTAGVFVAGLLWVGFVLDYSTTRDLYFTVAIVHVLVEVPALIRLC